MAMKLQFEFDVRKADELLRTLNEIKKGFGDIDQGRGGFGKQFSEQIRTSTDHIQKLQEAMRSGGQGSKGLEDFVRVSEKAFGIQMRALVDAQAKSMEALKKEINSTAESINTLTRVYERLERQEDSIENKRKMRAVSTRMVTEQARLDELQGVMQQSQQLQAAEQTATTGPGGWAGAAGMARAAGAGAMRAAGGVGAIAAAAGVPGRLEDQISLMETRRQATRFQFETQAAREAMQDDITRQMLRSQNITGSEALNRMRAGNMNAMDFGTITARMIGQSIRGLVSGGGLMSWEQAAYGRMSALEEADRELFAPLLGEGGRVRLEGGRAIEGFEAAFGMDAGQAALQRARAGGVTQSRAAQVLNMGAQFGVDLSSEAGAMFQYRLSENLVSQQARRRGFGVTDRGAVDVMGEMLGRSGLERHTGAGRTAVSQAVGQFLEGRTAAISAESVSDLMSAAMGMAQQGIAGGMTAEVAMGTAAQTAMGFMDRFDSGESFENMLAREQLRALGLGHAEREQVLRFGVGTPEFFRAIQAYRPDLSVEQIGAQFSSMMGEFEESIAGFHALDDDAIVRQAAKGLIPGVDAEQAREILSDPREARRFKQALVRDPATAATAIDRQAAMEAGAAGAVRAERGQAMESVPEFLRPLPTETPALAAAATTAVAEEGERARVEAVRASTQGAENALQSLGQASLDLIQQLNQLASAYEQAQEWEQNRGAREARESQTRGMSPRQMDSMPITGTARPKGRVGSD